MAEYIYPSEIEDLNIDQITVIQCCVQQIEEDNDSDPSTNYGKVKLHNRFAEWIPDTNSDFTLQDYLDEV